MEEIKISKKVDERLRDLMSKNNAIIGWNEKIRNGKIIVYVLKEKLSQVNISSIKVEDKEIPLEIFPVGRIRIVEGG
jgi:hypothetical protein